MCLPNFMSDLQHFNLPIDAIQYRSECPICQSEMSIDPKDIVGPIEYSKNNRLVFELDHASDDMVFVDVLTGDLRVSINRDSSRYLTGGAFATPNIKVYPNVMTESLTIKCQGHEHYSYTIKLWLDFDLGKVADLYLESEFLKWKDYNENIAHEVRNYYTSHTTKYNYYNGSFDYRPFANLHIVDIPMVPLNLSNPEETVSRIKNLLIFL
jgi:hypothetical protein